MTWGTANGGVAKRIVRFGGEHTIEHALQNRFWSSESGSVLKCACFLKGTWHCVNTCGCKMYHSWGWRGPEPFLGRRFMACFSSLEFSLCRSLNEQEPTMKKILHQFSWLSFFSHTLPDCHEQQNHYSPQVFQEQSKMDYSYSSGLVHNQWMLELQHQMKLPEHSVIVMTDHS